MCRILFASGSSISLLTRNIYPIFKSLSNGGNTDACGFAILYENGEVYHWKLPIACEDVGLILEANRKRWEKLLENAVYVMIHARKATGGTPLINRNNHPFCGKRWCIIHNGGVRVKSDVPEGVVKIKNAVAETDSAWILAILEYYNPKTVYDAVSLLSKHLEGKASVAAFEKGGRAFYTRNKLADIHLAFLPDKSFIATTAAETMKILASELRNLGIEVEIARSLKEAAKAQSTARIIEFSRKKREYYYYGFSFESGIKSSEKQESEMFTVVLINGRVYTVYTDHGIPA